MGGLALLLSGLSNWQTASRRELILQQQRADANPSALATKAQELTNGLETERECAFAICTWVATTFGDDELPPGFDNDVYGWFASRTGACGARSIVAAAMLETLGITSRTIGMYDFNATTDSHVCVEVYYDESWHLFDTMFGGYFKANNHILSWDEIVAAPITASQSLVPFEGTQAYRQSSLRTLRSAYSPETLQNLRSSGVQTRETTVLVYNQISLASLPFSFGTADSSYNDLILQGSESEALSAFTHMGLSAGDTFTLNLQTVWEFSDCVPGQAYYISYFLFSANAAGTPFYAAGQGAAITAGRDYVTSQGLVEQQAETWRIEFVPESANCSVQIGFNFVDTYIGADIDYIEIGLA